MFEGQNIPGVYALTAANGRESSWGTYCYPQDKVNGKSIGSCLGDLFSVNWMEDIDMEGDSLESLEKQYTLVRAETSKSHVMQYSDIGFTKERISDFIGRGSGAASVSRSASVDAELRVSSAVSVRDLHLHNLYHAYHLASTSTERIAAGKSLSMQLAAQQLWRLRFAALPSLA